MKAQDLILVSHFVTDYASYPKRYLDYELTRLEIIKQCNKLSGVLIDPDYDKIADAVWEFVLQDS